MKPEERAQEIVRLEGPRVEALLRAAKKLVKTPMAKAERRVRIIEIADKLSRAVSPHTHCAQGCSECCHLSLNISGYEARLIEDHTGWKHRILGRKMGETYLGLADELRVRFTGMACPFLNPGSCGCSIYPVRPFACRIHHTLANDSTDCRIRLDERGRAINPTPTLNFSIVGNASAMIFKGEDFGDIREFFPPDAPHDA